ncbi:MAG: GAF domain-containing protein [Desulfovibrionaceae bacterium]|nr:GAF domain-containing protein [Desulfovibrionaceae bacterium]
MKQRNEPLSVLLELSNFLSSALDLQSLFEGALAIVLKHFDLDSGRIYLLDPAEKILTLAAHMGMEISGLETMRLDEGFSGRAASTKSFIAQYVSELDDKERAALLSRKGLKIIICVPFIVMDRVEGVMNLAARKVIKLGQEEIDLLMTMGHHIGVASSNARVYRDLQQKLNEVEEKKQTIKFFAYSVSHDLKSPAIGLYGLTARLCRQYGGLLDERGRLYCDQILRTAQEIASLAEQINAYIATREVPLRIKKVSIKEILARLRQEFYGVLQERHISLQEPSFLPEIIADELHLTRAFRNLLDNALKYGGEQLSEIRIGYEEDELHHIFSVGDNGVGIKQEGIEEIFHLFHRLHTPNQTEGSGVGLAIVKEVAKKHLGDVWVESIPNSGATFYLSISRKLEAMDSISGEQKATFAD